MSDEMSRIVEWETSSHAFSPRQRLVHNVCVLGRVLAELGGQPNLRAG